MNTEAKSRSISAIPQGLKKVKDRMKDLERPDNQDKKGWTQEILADKSFLSLSTIKRFMKGESIDESSILSIAKALNLDILEIVDPKEWNQDNKLEIDWLKICHIKLENQQEQQRIRRKASAMGYEVNVHVPLGLVERKQQQRRNENVERKEIYQLEPEVITKTYQHQDFLQEVINKGYQGKNKHIAIVGEPGAGKTTLLNAIASDIKDKNQKLPIFISLGSLQGMTLADYILKKWLPDAIRLINIVPTSEIEAQLQTEFYQGNFYLLLDGVDEMGESSPIQPLNKISQELTSWLGQARVILTCRLNIWDATVNNNIIPGFNTFKTQEFNPEQVTTFIAEWFQVANNISAGKKLIAQLQKRDNERIIDLVNNPLRLCLLCQIFHRNDQGELPETKAQFYEIFTRYFYEWKPELVPDLIKSYKLREELHQALGNLALAGINSNVRFRLKRSFVVKEMRDEKLFNLACEVGWLNQVDRDTVNDEAVYAFFHPNFQEYFAALVINDWHYFLNHVPNNPEEGIYRIFEPQWKELILLWLGIGYVKNEYKEEFIKEICNFMDINNQEFILEFSYRSKAYSLVRDAIVEFQDCSLNQEEEFSDDMYKPRFQILYDAYHNFRFSISPIDYVFSRQIMEDYQLYDFLGFTPPYDLTKITGLDIFNALTNKLKVSTDYLHAINDLLNILNNSHNRNNFKKYIDDKDLSFKIIDVIVEAAMESLKAILESIRFNLDLSTLVIRSLKNNIRSQKNSNLYNSEICQYCKQIILFCAENMTYPEFYRAWHGEPSTIQNLETQFTDTHSHLSQLQPTEKTYPLTLNLKTLQNETDIIEISQEICNQIYFTACPENPEIPQINNAPQLKSKIPQIKKHLQTENLALIINNCEPNQEMIKFCNKLTDVLHIAFITEQPLDAPLKGFPNQSNLLNVIQHWINEIG
jgi:transcriptional regulator with XRE-family HTH domain/energy-coupling factor transporter ATP-binding protein EcfA2